VEQHANRLRHRPANRESIPDVTAEDMTKVSQSHRQTKVVVIGAGIVGLMTALEIQRSGRNVVVIEPGDPGGRQAASYGNGAWIHPGGIMPVSVPGLWRQVLGYLTNRSGPFVIRWAHFPHLVPWLVRFIWAGRNWKVVEECARVRFELCRHSPRDHRRIAAEAGVGHLIEQKGLLYIYPDKATFLSNSYEWDMRRRLGLAITEFEGDALRQLEPNLSDRYQYGVRVDDGAHCTDLKAYCGAIAGLLRQRGAKFVRSRASGFRMAGNRLTAVVTDDGDIECSEAVLTAGIGSGKLAAAGGDRVPLESERGYHVVFADGAKKINHPLMPSDGKMAITPTLQGLRVAGQVELAHLDAAPDWRRADVLHRFAATVFRQSFQCDKLIDQWMGHRPSTPDGLPIIGKARSCTGLYYGFGHGHSGLTQAPATARLLAAIVAGQKPEWDPSAMSVGRF